MEKSNAAKERLVAELEGCAATSPDRAVNAERVLAKLHLDEIEFRAAISYLTSLEKVGMIKNEIYLRSED